MKNSMFLIKFTFLIIVSLLYGSPVFDDISNWTVLSKSPVWVGWVEIDGEYWCESHKLIPFSIDKVSSVINDKKNYPNVFKRILTTDSYGDIVHVKLDMPFPFASRDYIVEYSEYIDNDTIFYNWSSLSDTSISESDKYVRLVNAAGQWKLISIDSKTYVYYRWNGELRGDFPDWALTRAWNEQGTEVLLWLEEYLESKKYD